MPVTRLRSTFAALFVLLSLLTSLAPALAQEPAGHGVNLTDMDLEVDPGVDFYRYANGGWLDRTTIPPDFPSIETMTYLDGHTRLMLVELLEARAASDDVAPGSDEWKAIRLYEQGTDLATRNAQGIAPLQPLLAEVAAVSDLEELHQFQQRSIFLSMPGLFLVSHGPDFTDSSRTIAYLTGPTLSLPSRDYYLTDDPAVDAVREGYQATAVELLTLIGRDPAEAARAVEEVYAFEARLAETTLSPEETRSFAWLAETTPLAELEGDYPLMDWRGYLDSLGLEAVDELVVTEPRYLAELDAIVRETRLPVIRDYLTLQLLFSTASSLSEEMETAAFAYFGTALSGLTVMAPVEGRTLDYVGYYLPDALGKLYVDAYFTPEAKAQGEELVAELIAAFRTRLERNSWMTDETRAAALAKLDTMRVKVGYPEVWQEYDEVEIGGSYLESALSAFGASYRHSLSQIGQPVDRDAWPFPPQTVNAMYNPLNNEIVLPAAILQAPLFDPAADPASNFGAIGYIIGHEITHGFDQEGAQFDAAGNLANWWTPADLASFEALNERVVAQYAAIEVAGRPIDGDLTLVENVADLGGVQVAYDALQIHLERHGRPLADTDDAVSLSQEQRFFIAAAAVWRAEVRPEALQTQLVVDTHAPASVRGTQPLRNMNAFHAAFGIAEGDPMYLAPEERVVIW